MSVSTLTTFALVVLALSTANALTCYKCDSAESVTCGYGITSILYDTEECGEGGLTGALFSTECFKITGKNKEGKEYIKRGCLPAGGIGCNALVSTFGKLSGAISSDPSALEDANCVTCNTDKCNSATQVALWSLLSLVGAAITFLF